MVPVQGHMVPTNGRTKLTWASGDRDETCARYVACLDAHLAAHRGRVQGGAETPASCPARCHGFSLGQVTVGLDE